MSDLCRSGDETKFGVEVIKLALLECNWVGWKLYDLGISY